MNVIIPMGGLGSRFTNDGYRFPKPLVNIVGRPMLFWLVDHLVGLTERDILWLALSAQMDAQFGLIQRMKAEYPHLDIRAVLLTFDTRGAAETLYTVLQSMDEATLARKTISLDCDTIYFEPVLERFRVLPAHHNATFYFEDMGGKAIFSYVQIDDGEGNEEGHQKVTQVREKVMISSWANTGAYAFCSASTLRRYCAAVLDDAVGEVGEYYTTNIMQKMIADHQHFAALRVHHSGFICVGTPRQLQDLLRNLKLTLPINGADAGEAEAQEVKEQEAARPVGLTVVPPSALPASLVQGGSRRMRFCFDLDNTLVTYPHVPNDYTSVQPITANIQLVRELHAAGHYIIIQTARGMKSHNGNVGAVIADLGHITLLTLQRFNIPYDELLFGKPHADVYVDDLAVHALLDTAKEIGWALNSQADGQQEAVLSPLARAMSPRRGFIAARHFNTLQEVDDTIVKTAATDLIAGEVHFYQHIPEDIHDLFPRCQRVEHNTLQPTVGSPSAKAMMASTSSLSTSNTPRRVSSLFIDKVWGVTFSHLYVNRALTTGRLHKLLSAIHRIHQSNGLKGGNEAPIVPMTASPSSDTQGPASWDMYANYGPKMRQRFHEFRELYEALNGKSSHGGQVGCVDVYHSLLDWFAEYAQAGRGLSSVVIHGDPVFSNALLSSQGTVTLIDMRGRVGDTLTLQGDQLYDLAKVYQSLDGYDFIIHDMDMQAVDQQHAAELNAVFEQFVQRHYPQVRLSDVQAATALLYFSLIPLHQNTRHQNRFIQCSKRLLMRARERVKLESTSAVGPTP